MEKPLVNDINYAKRKYYQLAFFSTETIKEGSEEIYLDDRNPANDQNAKDLSFSSFTARDLTLGAGKFDRLVPGRDYSMDYSRGMLIFRSPQPDNAVVCVNYQRPDGSFLVGALPGLTNYILIKDDQNSYPRCTEIKSYYNLGRTQIVRDDGRGNFFMKIVKDSGEEPTAQEWKTDTGLDSIPKYPDNIKIDFESGIFNIVDSSGNPWNVFPSPAYQGATGTHANYRFYIEYRYRMKIFTLRPGIVPQSEQVVLDGKTLSRDKDYFIDYDIGQLTFIDDSKFNDNSVIDVNYEYSQFGGMQIGETFVGIRNELSLTQNVFVGVSYLKNFPPRPQAIPDMRSVASDLEIQEIDSRVQNLKWGRFNLGFGGEFAQSKRNMNTYGKAMIDSMEGIKDGVGPALLKDSWKYGWTQDGYPPNALFWDNIDVLLRDIYGLSEQDVRDDRQSVLRVNYDLTRSTSCSIVQSLSPTGIDFSKKTGLEMRLLQVQRSGPAFDSDDKVIIEFGKFNEDADRDNSFDTEDISSNSVLNDGEDIGWFFNNPQWPLESDQRRIGPNNGLIDTEDLDGDRLFNMSDQPVEGKKFEIPLSGLQAAKWTSIQKNLEKISPDEWLYIKQVRITIQAKGKAGELQFAKIDAVGNKWETLTTGLTLKAINNYDDKSYSDNSLNNINSPMLTEYESLYGKALAGTTLKQEQALEMNYDFAGSSPAFLSTGTVAAKEAFTMSQDFSVHQKLKFFVFGDNNKEILSFRAYTDNDGNYFEYKRVVNWSGWKLITVNQVDINGDKIPEIWLPEQEPPDSNMIAECAGKGFGVGSPVLSKISYIKLIVMKEDTVAGSTYTALSGSGKIWVNEIHMTDSVSRDGQAYKLYSDMGIDGWTTFGGRYKWRDPNFETFDATALGTQESFEQSGYFNFTRLSFMPMNFTGGRTETRTSSIDKAADFVSILKVGRVISTNFTAGTSLNINKLPTLGYNYAVNTTSTSNESSKYFMTSERVSHSGNMNYGIARLTKVDPLDSFVPTSLSLSGSRVTNTDEPWNWEQVSSTTNPKKIEYTDSYSISAPFQMFWNRFSLSPSYSRSKTYEEKKIEDFPVYDKAAGQNIGLNSSLKINDWLVPRFNYSIGTNESYDFSSADPEKISKVKSVTRNGSGSVSAEFGIAKILPKLKPTKSLNLSSSYSIQDGDKYDAVGSTYAAFTDIWIRDPLKNGTLSSLSRSDTINSSGRWNIFEGVPFKGRMASMNKTYTSLNYSETRAFTSNTGTRTKSQRMTWPDMTINIYDTEKMLGIEQYIYDTNLTLTNRYNTDKQLTVINDADVPQTENNTLNNTLSLRFNLKRFINSLSYNYGNTVSKSFDFRDRRYTSMSKSWNFALQPSFDAFNMTLTPRYSFQEDKAWAGDPGDPVNGPTIARSPTQDLRTETGSIGFYKNTSFPGGMYIPIIGKTLPLKNQFIFNASLSYTRRDTDLGNIAENRTNEYGLTMSGNYTISDNLIAEVGGGYNRFQNREVRDKNWTSYNLNAKLSITF